MIRHLILIFLLAGSMLAQAPPKKDAPTNTTFISGPTIGDSTVTAIKFTDLPHPTISLGGTYILKIDDKDGKLMVQITHDGKVTYGDGYHADQPAREFWEAFTKYYSFVCNDPAKVSPEAKPK